MCRTQQQIFLDDVRLECTVNEEITVPVEVVWSCNRRIRKTGVAVGVASLPRRGEYGNTNSGKQKKRKTEKPSAPKPKAKGLTRKPSKSAPSPKPFLQHELVRQVPEVQAQRNPCTRVRPKRRGEQDNDETRRETTGEEEGARAHRTHVLNGDGCNVCRVSRHTVRARSVRAACGS